MVPSRQMPGLGDEIEHVLGHQSEFCLVIGAPRCVFDHACHRAAIQRQQVSFACQSGDDPRQRRLVLRGARDRVVEVRQHFEMLRELRVGVGQEMVQRALAEQHDLDVERNRIGFQRDRRSLAAEAGGVLDGDFLADQGPLEGRPAQRLAQQGACLDQQDALVGAVQGTGLDQPEIRRQCSLFGAVFDAAEQIAQGGMQFFDDGGAACVAGLCHQDIHVIAGQGLGPGCRHGRFLSGGGCGHEKLHILFQISRHGGQEVAHGRIVREPRAGFLDLRGNCKTSGFLIECTQLITLRLFQPGQAAQGLFERLLDLRDRCLGRRSLRFGPFGKLVRRHDGTVLGRGDGETGLGADNDQTARGGLGGDTGERSLALRAKRLLDSAAAGLIAFRLKRGGQGGFQILDQFAHRGAQGGRPASGKADGDGPMRCDEVIHINPVGRTWAGLGGLFQHWAHRLQQARATGADGEDIEATYRHFRAELQGVARAGLALQAIDRGEVGRGGKGEAGQIGGSIERFRRQGNWGGGFGQLRTFRDHRAVGRRGTTSFGRKTMTTSPR